MPGSFEPFETAIRAVLGQQVSVQGATTLSGRLVRRFGSPLPTGQVGLEWAFPTAQALAAAAVPAVRGIGLPEARARALIDLSRAIADGRVDLSSGSDPEQLMEQLQTVRGLGPWTAHYLAMRVLRWPNAFPGGDLALRKALGVVSASAAQARATAWQPWRAYAVMHLWSSLSKGG